MALKAGYHGIKNNMINRIKKLPDTIDALVESFVKNTDVLVNDTVGWIGKNLIVFPYEVESFPNTNHGVVFNLGDEKRIVASSGTATGGNTNLALTSRLETSAHCLKLPKGKYVLNGNPKGKSNHDFYLFAATTLNNAYSAIGTTQDTDSLIIDVDDAMMESRGYAPIAIYVVVREGIVANGEIFEPMLRKIGVIDDTYEPYHETVDEMLSAIITAATDAADFAAFKTAMGAITPVTRTLALSEKTLDAPELTEDEPIVKKTTRKATKKTEEV